LNKLMMNNHSQLFSLLVWSSNQQLQNH
jgi:hypothetical protein